ncbi:hypothetical protein AMECASPLE_033244 [Ameca splendens]|uniref:Uncharacterized protein n=1 Tax=Ameca splendens TaxID=208324 RepID=A0ABV0Z4P8_9TELE
MQLMQHHSAYHSPSWKHTQTHTHTDTHTHMHTHTHTVILSGIDTTAHCSLLLCRSGLHGLGDGMGVVGAASRLSNADTHRHITCYEGSGWGNPLIYCFLSWTKKHTHLLSLSASLPFPHTHTHNPHTHSEVVS